MTPPTTLRLSHRRMFAVMPNDEFDRFHKRKNPRLRYYDYAKQNYYFVTICTHEKRCIYGNPQRLSQLGQIAYTALEEVPKHFSDITIDKFVIMPNHVHAIVIVQRYGTDLSVVIGQYKAHVTKQIRKLLPHLQVWQTSFHDHVIRNQTDYARIWNYIDTNPARWEDDCFYCDSTKDDT